MLTHPSPFSSPLVQGRCGRSRPPRCVPQCLCSGWPANLQSRSHWRCWCPWPAPHVQWALVPFCASISLLGKHLPRHTRCCGVLPALSRESKAIAWPDVSYRQGERRRNEYPTGVRLQPKRTLPEHTHLLPAPQPMRMLKIQISNI